jgi:hypothetical protein
LGCAYKFSARTAQLPHGPGLTFAGDINVSAAIWLEAEGLPYE